MAFTPKLTYKGRPLVRCGNDLYYGSMKDPYVVYLHIPNPKDENGVKVADKGHIVLMSTDQNKPEMERIVRQANKAGLYNALSFGDIMLQGVLNKKKYRQKQVRQAPPKRACRIWLFTGFRRCSCRFRPL